MDDYISRNRPEWEELEKLLARARRSVRRMKPEELSRLDVLYRRTTVHLARISTRARDATLAEYLGRLVAAAHSVIYLSRKRRAPGVLWAFLARGFPSVVAGTWKYHAVAALLLLLGSVAAFFAVRSDPAAAYPLLPAGEFRLPGVAKEDLAQVLANGRDLEHGQKFLFASFLFGNNLKVGLLSLTTGVLAAVPTVLLLVYNGMILGAMAAVYHAGGIHADFWAWILPHAVTELLAIVLCGGIGLLLGRAVVAPGLLRRTESLKRAGVTAVRIACGVTLMIAFAAAVESYLRQSHLSNGARFAFAGAAFVVWGLYFGWGFALVSRTQAAAVTAGSPPGTPRSG